MKKAFEFAMVVALVVLSVMSLSAQNGAPKDTARLWSDPLRLPYYNFTDSLMKMGPVNLVLFEGKSNSWYKIKQVFPDTTWVAQEIEINSTSPKVTWSSDMVYGSGQPKFFNTNFQYVGDPTKAGDRAGTLEVNCTTPCRIAVWSERYPGHGSFTVTTDARAPVNVITAPGTNNPQGSDKDRNLSSYTSPTLKPGAHILKIKVTTQSAIDRFTLLRPTVVFK